MRKTRILVIGAGSIGIFFGSRLALAGADVAVVARHDFEIASKQGYLIDNVGERYSFTPSMVLREPAEYPGVADYILVATKVLPKVDLKSLLQPVIRSRETAILLIQNGVEIEEPIAEAFPENELLSSIAYICASRPTPGTMLNEGGGRLRMGSYPNGISEKAKKLAELFESVKTECILSEEIRFDRWNKLLWNLPYNPVSVLAGSVETTCMTDGSELEKLCWNLMREVIAVANANGIGLTEEHARKQVEFTRTLSAYRTSMLQDFIAGREMEVEAILGNPVRLARRYGVSVPCMETCYALLQSVNFQKQQEKVK